MEGTLGISLRSPQGTVQGQRQDGPGGWADDPGQGCSLPGAREALGVTLGLLSLDATASWRGPACEPTLNPPGGSAGRDASVGTSSLVSVQRCGWSRPRTLAWGCEWTYVSPLPACVCPGPPRAHVYLAGPEQDSTASLLSAPPFLYPQTLAPDRHLGPDL